MNREYVTDKIKSNSSILKTCDMASPCFFQVKRSDKSFGNMQAINI